jgi:hypothetical protein
MDWIGHKDIMLSLANKKIIQEAVKNAAEILKPRLQPTNQHPERNAYAHIWREIKLQMNCKYDECNDEDVDKILSIINNCA